MTVPVIPLAISIDENPARHLSPLSRVLSRFSVLDQLKQRTSPKRHESKASRDSMWINKMVSGHKLDDAATRALVANLLSEPLVQSSLAPSKARLQPPASVPARRARPSCATKKARPSYLVSPHLISSPPKRHVHAHVRWPGRDVVAADDGTETASCSSASTASSQSAFPKRPAYAGLPIVHREPDQLDCFMSLCAQQRRHAIGASQQPTAPERRAWPTPRCKRPVGGFVGSQRDTTAYHREVLECDALDEFLAQADEIVTDASNFVRNLEYH